MITSAILPDDILIAGAGAAGLAAAIFTCRHAPHLRVMCIDGAARLGAKILVSGGGRCNVTNVRVTVDDFHGGNRKFIRRVLAALPVKPTVEFFRQIGVELYEDYSGKLFPTTDKARTVLTALTTECERLGIQFALQTRVQAVHRTDDGFRVVTTRGERFARRVLLATGGLSLPKTGSDGAGYAIARSLGHSIVPPVPALVPLTLSGDAHVDLSGISHSAELTLQMAGCDRIKVRGDLLWTHFGISGPVALDASRHWNQAARDGQQVDMRLSFVPGASFEQMEAQWCQAADSQPRVRVVSLLAEFVPGRVAAMLARYANVTNSLCMAHMSRDQRRRIVHALLELPVPVSGSRGYTYAEVTAGGVPLDEVDPATMQSRCCPGLYLVGEILDCDGRIGGFNFQWAWSTAFAAGRSIGSDQRRSA